MTKTSSVKTSSALKSGSKMEKLFHYLKKEMVGSELIFTGENAKQLMSELSMGKPEFVWNMLQALEEKGLIHRRRLGYNKGIAVSFPIAEKEPQSEENRDPGNNRSKRSVKKSKQPSRAEKSSRTLNELISDLDTEIEGLKKRLDSRTKLHGQLVAARAELMRR